MKYMEWHVITDPASPELDRLAERYHLHPLHIEDCRHRNQSAKIEEGDGYLFTVLKVIRQLPDESLRAVDFDIFFGADFVITVSEEDCPEMHAIIDQARQAPGPAQRPDQVFYRLIDHVVDSYLPVLDQFHEKIDTLEDEALE
jgi:magnesium transporter